ncbi:MAG: hypothetical protein LBH03_01095 [Holophagales bacterium]|jgi:hypothetical protein|nr:hypothetical protein [Holophagales bacterium]
MFFSFVLLTLSGIADNNPETRLPDTHAIKIEQSSNIPTSKEIIESAKKALRGTIYSKIKPYTLSYILDMDINPMVGDSMIIDLKSFYKEKKWRQEGKAKKIKSGISFSAITISDLNKTETWEEQKTMFGVIKWKKVPFVNSILPCPVTLYWDNMIFDEPVVIKENGLEYYRLNAKFSNPQYKDWDYSYFFNVNDYLLYKSIGINNKMPFKENTEYSDYYSTQGITIARQVKNTMTSSHKGKPITNVVKTTITDFKFKSDIPDSLFVVPKK